MFGIVQEADTRGALGDALTKALRPTPVMPPGTYVVDRILAVKRVAKNRFKWLVKWHKCAQLEFILPSASVS